MGFEPLKRILHRSLSSSSSRNAIEVARIFFIWDEVLREQWGKEKAAYVHPVSFREGVLKVTTASSAAKHMLEIDKNRLKQDVNRRIGSLKVHLIITTWRP